MQKYKKNIIEGIASDSIIFVLGILIGFAVIPVYLKFISLEEFGIYIAIQSIIAVISLADIGMPVYSIKKMSNDIFFNSEELKAFLNSAQIFQYLLAIALLFLGVVVAFYVGTILDLDAKYLNISYELFLLFWLSVIVGVICGLNHAILKSRHELKYMNIAVFMILVLSSVLNILFLFFNYGLLSFGLSIFLVTIVVNIFIFLKVHKEYNINLFIPKQFHKIYIIDGWQYIKQFQLLRIAQVSKSSLFSVLLSNYGSQVLLAQYNITNKVPGLIPGFISKVVMNLFPSISSHFENDEKEKLVPYFEKVFKLGVFTTLFCLYALFALNETFITLWVGVDKFIGLEIFVFILLNFIFLTLISFTGIIIHSSGEFKKMPLLSFVEVIVFLTLSYILYKAIGINGFFIGYLLSMMIGLVYSLILVNTILSINIYKWIFDECKKFVILLIFMILSDYFINAMIESLLVKLFFEVIIFIVLFLFLSGSYTKINLLRFFVVFYRATIRRINKKLIGGDKIVSRTACLGDDIINRLYGNTIENINFPKNRVDLLNSETNNKISLMSLYKMFNRYDILSNSIYMQNKIFYDKDIKPKAIIFDSFSELTDQKFTHKTKTFSFYCNFSDLNSDSKCFKQNIIIEGLLNMEDMEKYYQLAFQKCIDTWGNVPIIFIHFPTKLDKREQFVKRGHYIKKTVEKLSYQFKNLYSISIDDSVVNFANIGDDEYRKLPYHYNDQTYIEFVMKIKQLGVL